MSLESSLSIHNGNVINQAMPAEAGDAEATTNRHRFKEFLVVAAKVTLVVVATIAIIASSWAMYHLGLPLCTQGNRLGSVLVSGAAGVIRCSVLPIVVAISENAFGVPGLTTESCIAFLKHVTYLTTVVSMAVAVPFGLIAEPQRVPTFFPHFISLI